MSYVGTIIASVFKGLDTILLFAMFFLPLILKFGKAKNVRDPLVFYLTISFIFIYEAISFYLYVRATIVFRRDAKTLKNDDYAKFQ